jgi:hypothetical protein
MNQAATDIQRFFRGYLWRRKNAHLLAGLGKLRLSRELSRMNEDVQKTLYFIRNSNFAVVAATKI